MIATILYPCPNRACSGKHALCWMQSKRKRELGVICNDFGNGNKFLKLKQSITDSIMESDIEGIPTHHTPEARKKIENVGNLQFVMMVVAPGERVERNFETMSEDNKKAQKFLSEIEKLKKQQSELQTEIEKLARKQIALESQEREVREKLREVYTAPLNLQ